MQLLVMRTLGILIGLGLAACNTHSSDTQNKAGTSAVTQNPAAQNPAAQNPAAQNPTAQGSDAVGAARAATEHTDLARAVDQAQAASPAASQPANGGAATDPAAGPSPNGIVDAQRAQQEAALGSVPKLTLANNGSEPRVQLGGPDLTGLKEARIGQVELAVRTGPRAVLPSVNFKLEVTGVANKAAAASKAAPEGKTGTAQLPAYVFEVVGAELARTQARSPLPEDAAEIAKIKGSRFELPIQSGLAAGALRLERAKSATEAADLLLACTGSLFGSLLYAFPAEPVGAGALWMVSSRETFMDNDVVAYRLYRVEAVDGQRVTLNVSTKRFVVGTSLKLPGIADNQLTQFEATDSIQMHVLAGQRLPVEGQFSQRLDTTIIVGSEPSNVQIESRSLFAFPPKLAASSPSVP